MSVTRSRDHGAREAQLGPLLEDLRVLVDGPGLTLRLGREQGGVALKSGGKLLYSGKGGRAWKRVPGRTRTAVLLAWIRDAACVARGRLLQGSRGA